MMSNKKKWPESDIRSILSHIYILCLAPGLVALWLSFSARGEGHIFSMEILVHYLAAGCLFMLTLTLAITPLARMLAQPNLGIIRRPFGLAAFGYAFAHWVAIFFLYEFNGTAIWFAFGVNPALLVALLALLLMVPMVVTMVVLLATRPLVRAVLSHQVIMVRRNVPLAGLLLPANTIARLA